MTLSLMSVLAGALVGAALGAIYLGLLWVAVRSLPRDRSGVRVFVALGLARVALLIGTLMAAAALGLPAQGIAAAVAGFIALRVAATRWLGAATPGDTTWK
ncbi:ATP synthase subunit I [Rhodovulum euryhalinum]|uniref:F1F0 ATPase subunit 2 n=1 Tax=Rhodovulum euryhalinum TaxID=35805 RepID=A0A4R2K724_9RHOB|nr:ATP synthase subunit I [Rhodovulum euryhalinum]TCO69111.1 F1F0 ATPase subunit 2 [Rhodovulum euryhalinum]